MKHVYVIFTLFLLAASVASVLRAQEQKVVKVLDSNLFELSDGRQVYLANVAAPSVSDSIKKMAHLAAQIKNYAEEQLLNQKVRIEFPKKIAETQKPIPVHIFRKFPLNTAHYNKIYLEQGMGRFTPTPESVYHLLYMQVAKKARERYHGIWDIHLKKPTIRIASLALGGGAFQLYNERKDAYRELRVSTYPMANSNGFGFTFSVIREIDKSSNEDTGDSEYFTYGIPYHSINGKYFGLQAGLMILDLGDDAEIDRVIGDFFILPSLQFKIGRIDKLYLTFDFLTDFPYTPLSFGLNYLSETPYLKISGNYAATDDERIFSLKSEMALTRTFLLNLAGVAYQREAGGPETYRYTFGGRIGLGYIFR